MAYSTIPPNPAFRARWDAWANTLADNVRELVTDVPAMKTQVTQATTRVSQAETAITALQNSSASTASTAGTALSTAQAAATSAAAASTAAQTAQAAASQAATDAATSASSVSGLSTTVGTHTTQIASLTSGKADNAALAAVAFTGRWADLIGAPTSSGGAAAILASTTFAGTADGASWPAPWTVGRAPTGGSVTVQSGRGQLATGTTTGNYSSVDGASARYTTQIADFDLVFTFRRVSGVHVRVVARCDTGSLDPQDGIIVGVDNTALTISTVAGYTYTQHATAPKTWTQGVDFRVRARAVGGTIQARSWDPAAAEPSTWDVTATTTRLAAGWLGFWAGTGAGTASVVALIDDITLTEAVAASGGSGAAFSVTTNADGSATITF